MINHATKTTDHTAMDKQGWHQITTGKFECFFDFWFFDFLIFWFFSKKFSKIFSKIFWNDDLEICSGSVISHLGAKSPNDDSGAYSGSVIWKGGENRGQSNSPLFRRLTVQNDGNDGFDVNPKRNEVVSGWLESVYNSKSTNRQNFIPLLSCEK